MHFLEDKIMWNFGREAAFFGTKLFVKDKKANSTNKMKTQSRVRSLTFSMLIQIPLRKPANPALNATREYILFKIAPLGIKHKLFLLKECSSNIKH